VKRKSTSRRSSRRGGSAAAKARSWQTVSQRLTGPSKSRTPSLDSTIPTGRFLPGLAVKRLEQPPTPTSGGGFRPRVIIRDEGPDDDRTQVTDTTVEPFPWICSLSITTPPGPSGTGGFVGTGFLIGPRTIVTAGHCVFSDPWEDEDRGLRYGRGWAASIHVRAGRNGSTSVAEADAVHVFSVDEWTRSQREEFDFGAILLNKPLGDDLGFFGFGAPSDTELKAMNVNVAGYPGERSSELWMHANRIVDVSATQLIYKVDTTGGQSGSPVIHWDGRNDYLVVGIHNRGSKQQQLNFASRITPTVFAKLTEWKSATTDNR
jgi:V8-like Glu-specific endopeptidase